MIGRKEEILELEDCLRSKRPEFLAVYGRRRVGKTFLIKEYFKNDFAFYATGVPGLDTAKQLKVFNESLKKYGDKCQAAPNDWFEAFSRLEAILESPDVTREYVSGKIVVFLDELPWMDTARSDLKSALDYFWNSWGSSQNDLLFIICGSATSWIINNIVKDTGGFYNRITRQIHLMPFHLGECEELLRSNGVVMSRQQIIESYMIFGGVPYYLNYMRPQLSLAQNVDVLFFRENSPLKDEFSQLYAALFRNSEHYVEIIKALAKKKSGMTRQELIDKGNVTGGKTLTKNLSELEQCGFIRKYHDFTKKKKGCFYQLVDPLTLFCLTFLESGKAGSWLDYINTPSYYSWCGLAFEMVCLLHIGQIKKSLQIGGISSNEFSWRSRDSEPGAQIDLLIDRKDDVINVCEMKYSVDEFAITSGYREDLLRKLSCFRSETGTKKALHLTFVASGGLRHNQYSDVVVNEINGDDLFG